MSDSQNLYVQNVYNPVYFPFIVIIMMLIIIGPVLVKVEK